MPPQSACRRRPAPRTGMSRRTGSSRVQPPPTVALVRPGCCRVRFGRRRRRGSTPPIAPICNGPPRRAGSRRETALGLFWLRPSAPPRAVGIGLGAAAGALREACRRRSTRSRRSRQSAPVPQMLTPSRSWYERRRTCAAWGPSEHNWIGALRNAGSVRGPWSCITPEAEHIMSGGRRAQLEASSKGYAAAPGRRLRPCSDRPPGRRPPSNPAPADFGAHRKQPIKQGSRRPPASLATNR